MKLGHWYYCIFISGYSVLVYSQEKINKQIITFIQQLYPELQQQSLNMPNIINYIQKTNTTLEAIRAMYPGYTIDQIETQLKTLLDRKKLVEQAFQESKNRLQSTEQNFNKSMEIVTKQYQSRLEKNFNNLFDYLQKTDKKKDAQKIVEDAKVASHSFFSGTKLDLTGTTYKQLKKIYQQLKDLFFIESAQEKKQLQEAEKEKKLAEQKAQELLQQQKLEAEKEKLAQEQAQKEKELQEKLAQAQELDKKKAIQETELQNLQKEIGDANKKLTDLDNRQNKIVEDIKKLFQSAQLENPSSDMDILKNQFDQLTNFIKNANKNFNLSTFSDLPKNLDTREQEEHIAKLKKEIAGQQQKITEHQKDMSELYYDAITMYHYQNDQIAEFNPKQTLENTKKLYPDVSKLEQALQSAIKPVSPTGIDIEQLEKQLTGPTIEDLLKPKVDDDDET